MNAVDLGFSYLGFRYLGFRYLRFSYVRFSHVQTLHAVGLSPRVNCMGGQGSGFKGSPQP